MSLSTPFYIWLTFLLQVLCTAQARLQSHAPTESVLETFFEHSAGQRVYTDAAIYAALIQQHPKSEITIVERTSADLLAFASSGSATIQALSADEPHSTNYKWRTYQPPFAGTGGGNGTLLDDVKFGTYLYAWSGVNFTMYIVDARDGVGPYPVYTMQYLIGPSEIADKLILAAGQFTSTLHGEVWVFDQGYWQKDPHLWQSIQHASWANVILPKTMKDAIRNDVSRFFNSQSEYAKLNVPWKRGVIFHGPPGNGKTISIKAIMHSLYDKSPPIPTLYVKTLNFFAEFALKAIFDKARESTPCFLVFEDLDSLVTPVTRSYFLNQVDGLQSNDGILMVGSTNHLELLDPGIANRPSRFDRKYLFPDPDLDQRVAYAEYWRFKLKDNKEIEYPDVLLVPIGKITEGFSFAYMQEAFVASLLEITFDEEEVDEEGGGDEWGKLKLWRVFKKVVIQLRRELENERMEVVEAENLRRLQELNAPVTVGDVYPDMMDQDMLQKMVRK